MTAPAATAPDLLEANLRALAAVDPALAQRLRETAPATLRWERSRQGAWTATVTDADKPLWLASRYDPLAEAAALTAEVDPRKHACAVVLGVGLGYHVLHLASRMEDGMLVVFEPDLALLRATLERIDHSPWLGRRNVLLGDENADRAWLLQRLEGLAGVVTQGVALVSHPPSRQRHGDRLKAQSEAFTQALAYCRTNVATALVNSARTVENLACNLAHYAAGAGADELHLAARGYPAVCVGAGPSLARNIDLLRNPDLRNAVVVITAQTALKVLLKHGVTPDYVTALDYAEISRRFYEGLPPLPGVTLVAEPKAHPTILDSFPGPVRVTPNAFLDRLLGPLASPRVKVRDGTTVAHLSFYLAQHLGCDPILLIGQDLAFSDGLYYMPGTAIHDVWAPELNAFNTLEMLEWQRIVRHRGVLSRHTDVHGRTVFSDEQMLTYLKQFERDFAQAPQRVIDCTQGGLPKTGAQIDTLENALRQHALRPVPTLPRPQAAFDPARLLAAQRQLQRRLEETRELRIVAEQAEPILDQLLALHREPQRQQKLYPQLRALQNRITQLNDMFELVNQLNTIGSFKRIRQDRWIAHEQHADALAEQAQRLRRDIENVQWLRQACDEAITTLERALARLTQALRQHAPTAGAHA
jgi:hypothetical protein